jgi:hypothetical protein
LTDPLDQIKVFAFLETIDINRVPFVPLDIRRQGDQVILSFDSIVNGRYVIRANDTLTNTAWGDSQAVTGNGQVMEVPIAIDRRDRNFRLGESP